MNNILLVYILNENSGCNKHSQISEEKHELILFLRLEISVFLLTIIDLK